MSNDLKKLPQASAKDVVKNLPISPAKKPEKVPVPPPVTPRISFSFWEKVWTIVRRVFNQKFEDAAIGKRVELPNVLSLLTGGWWKLAVVASIIAGLFVLIIKFL